MNNKNEYNEEELPPALKAWMERRDRLSDVDIKLTLEALGADGNQDNDRAKWKIQGIGNIIVKNQTWFNGNLHVSGHGSVWLVKHAMQMENDTEAMKWLAERFPDALEGVWTPKEQEEFEEKSFTPPERFDNGLEDVRNYLVQERGLPKELIDREIEAGRLYSTRKWDRDERKFQEPQCVFIGPASAEIRSTHADGFKGCCKGSDSERSGYQVMFQGNHKPALVITEAAIDALSHHAMEPEKFCISTNGAGRFELQLKLTLEATRNGFATEWALDADHPGDIAAQRLFNALYLRRHFSKEFGIPAELVDDWILQQKLISIPAQSPHEIFLNDIDNTEHQIHKMVKDPDDASKMIPEDTGQTSGAIVRYKFLKACAPAKRNDGGEFALSPADIKELLEEFNVMRKRPVGAKDWNEVWKRKGPQAVKDYNDRVQKGAPVQPDVEGVLDITPSNSVHSNDVVLTEHVSQDQPKPKNRFARNPRSSL